MTQFSAPQVGSQKPVRTVFSCISPSFGSVICRPAPGDSVSCVGFLPGFRGQPSPAWQPPRPTTSGSLHRLVRCSHSATRRPTDQSRLRSTSRSSAWLRPPTAAGTGWWHPTGDLQLRRRQVLRIDRRTSSSTSRSSAWLRPPTAAGTGSWHPTGVSSASATPSSTARPAACGSTSPSSAMAPTKDGKGYWLVASDGGIFSFGDAQFHGSTGAINLNKPVVGMTPHQDDWLLARRIRRRGLQLRRRQVLRLHRRRTPTEPAEKIVPPATVMGYWVVDQNGTAYPFGDASGAPPDDGSVLLEADAGRCCGPVRVRPVGKALHLGRKRTGRLRLLRAGARFLGERRGHLASRESPTTST